MDLSQKRHDRPIAIENIAIEKVPCTRLQGFSETQNKIIQQRHRELLKEAQKLCEENQSNQMEVAFLIDLHDWDNYWIIKGTEERIVKMGNNPQALQAMDIYPKNSLLLMHNHPSTGTFSGEDFKTFCNTDSLYIVTVVGNDGSVYLLIKDKEFDIANALEFYGDLTQKYIGKRNNATLAMRELLRNADKVGLIYKKGRKKL